MPVTFETRAMVLLAAQICEDKKGTETRILELDPADAGFTDFFLITSGNNTRQTGAIADEIEIRMKRDFGTYAKSVEGRRSGEWILLDYVDFVVHIFTEETREYYDIERLRKSAKAMDTHELSAALREKTEAARKKAPAKKATADAAPQEEAALEKSARKAPPKTAAKKAPAKKIASTNNIDKSRPAELETIPKAKKAPAKKAAAKSLISTDLEAAPPKKIAKKTPAKKATI